MRQTSPNYQEDVRLRGVLPAWLDVRRRSLSGLAFALNRLTGIALTFYLILHLIVLSTLLQGEDGWDTFIGLARSPIFLSLDVILFFGILFHGLNGIRIILIGLGIGARHQRAMLYALGAVGTLLLIGCAVLIFMM